jgi:hypothetical protein
VQHSITIKGILGWSVLALSSAMAQTTTTTTPLIPFAPPMVSTIPTNGDVNPYGVAIVPSGFPAARVLNPGDILVSNFNNSMNVQGTGSTILRAAPNGTTSTFFQGPAGVGLTAALGVVKHGFVFIGNMPTTDGTSATVSGGSLLMLNRIGTIVGSVTDSTVINGPWGMAVNDLGNQAQLFISNVLNGTVMRLDLAFFENSDTVLVKQSVQVGGNYAHRLDPNALVLGPSGLAYDAANDILYVASSADNAVYSIPNAGSIQSFTNTGTMIYQDANHLHGPIDMVLAPNGDLIVANSDGSNENAMQPSEIVEFSTKGQFVSQFSIDASAGGAFGLALVNLGGAVRFAAVDDVTNMLTTWTVPIQ